MSKRVRAGLRIPYDLNTWLILEAKKKGISKNSLILQILWKHMSETRTAYEVSVSKIEE